MSVKQPPFSNSDDAVNNFNNMVEDATCAQRYVSFDAAQAYLYGHLSIKILIREIGIVGGDCHYYLAILQKRQVLRKKLKWLSVPKFWSDDGMGRSGPYRNNEIVCVSISEEVQQDECITVKPKVVPSFVRFQTLNKSDRSLAILPKIVERLCFEVGSMPKDREAKFLERIGFNASGACNKMVQSGAGVEDNVPDDCAPSQRDRLMRIQDQMLRSVRVNMDTKHIWVTRDESVDLGIEICEMFLCPFYLGAWAESWVRITGGHVLHSERGIY
ncbi:MAG: hypothetical protein HY082_00850 [Gammaproteobacteria bacterium]|nr:hypothetical protein [Gammaproteobacteria bacterium]